MDKSQRTVIPTLTDFLHGLIMLQFTHVGVRVGRGEEGNDASKAP